MANGRLLSMSKRLTHAVGGGLILGHYHIYFSERVTQHITLFARSNPPCVVRRYCQACSASRASFQQAVVL
jgi:hypothetical protein